MTDEAVRPGVVSMAHSWGGLPDETDEHGSNSNRMINCDRHCEAINAMAWMSGFPVSIRPTQARQSTPETRRD